MESTALSGLTSFVTSNVTNGWFQDFPNEGQKKMLHITIFCLACLFYCSVSASRLRSNVHHEAGARCFEGMMTIFSAMSVAILSAFILSGYFKWLSYFFCSIPVIVHTISDKHWFHDWFPKPPPLLPLHHQHRAWRRWFPWISMNGVVALDQEQSHVGDAVEQIHAINIPVP